MRRAWRWNATLASLLAAVLFDLFGCSGHSDAMHGTTTPPASATSIGAAGMSAAPSSPPAAGTIPNPTTPAAPTPGPTIGTPAAMPQAPQPVAGSGGASEPPGPQPASGGNPHWLSYGNGPKNQFYNPAETTISVQSAPMLKVLWMTQLGEITGAPAVVGDKVYVASNAGLFGVDAKSGSMLWRANITSTSAPFYDEESKLLIVSSQSGNIHGVDAETGMVKWMERISMQNGTYGYSSPIVSKNMAVVGVGSIDMGSYKGGVAAFDKLTGMKLWEYLHAKTAGASVWSGPGADDDGVIYATSGNSYGTADDRSDAIFAVAAAGTLMWNFQAEPNDAWTFSGGVGPDNDFGANPIIVEVNGRKLIAAGRKSGHFHLLDRTTGQEIVSPKLCERTSMRAGGILNNGAYDGKNQLFIAAANENSSPGQTVAMSADPDMKLAEAWRIKNTGVVWAPISTANGVCFLPDDTVLRVLDCKDGKELTKFMLPGTIGSAPSISEGRVFVGSGFSYAFGGGAIRGGRDLVAIGFE